MIKRIVLHKYKPLGLNNLDTLDITITSILTLILGTNGCGKSSVMRELSPFPANVSDYNHGGYKYIEIHHNNSIYILVSVFKKSIRHYFIKDGVNLNPGAGLITAQKQLVEEHFGYTANIHQFLIWGNRFTSLTATARKDILSEICPMDMTYVNQIFNKLKDRHRDIQGALKHTNTKLADLHLRLSAIPYSATLDQQKTKLEEKILTLANWTSGAANTSRLEEEIISNISKIDEWYDVLKKLDVSPILKSNFNTIEKLISLSGVCEGRIAYSKSTISDLENSILELRNVESSIKDNSLSETDVRSRLATLILELDKYKNIPVILGNCLMYSNSLRQLHEGIMLIHNNYSTIKTIYTKAEIEKIRSKHYTLQAMVNSAYESKSALEHKLAHINNLDVTECPKCHALFKIYEAVGDTPEERITSQLNEVIAKIPELEKELVKIEEELEHTVIYVNSRQSIITLKRTISVPDGFWDKYNDVDSIISSPHKALSYITKWINTVDANIDRESKLQEIDSINKLIEIYDKYGSSFNVSELSTLEKKHSDEVRNYQFLLWRYTDVNDKLSRLKSFSDAIDNISNLYTKTDGLVCTLTDILIANDASKERSNALCDLASIEGNVNKYHVTSSQIEALKTESYELTESLKIHALLLEAISPRSGIIADQLLGFINSFINELNNVISTIWNYKLEVLPCEYNNGKMDYTFPFNRDGDILSDISMGSTGQRDIIDLAFIIIIRQYLNINFVPLYLDETGATFDELHRNRLLTYIKSLYEYGVCEQVFMINHYSTFHSSLSTAEVIVLDDSNIATPIKYNTGVVLNGNHMSLLTDLGIK